jgi:hypothetical protein
MLKPAYIYKDKLQDAYNSVIFNDKYKYYNNSNYWNYEMKLSNDSWSNIEMVSVDSKDNILGFFQASISRESDKISAIGIINFYDKNIIFSRDMYNFLVDLFDKFNFRKIEWTVVVGNDDAEKMYDRIINKYGGKIVGVKEKSTKLIDGLYYNVKLYEIFKEDFERSRFRCK